MLLESKIEKAMYMYCLFYNLDYKREKQYYSLKVQSRKRKITYLKHLVEELKQWTMQYLYRDKSQALKEVKELLGISTLADLY